MNLQNLTQEQKDELLTHFRGAVEARVNQWDHELGIETILDEDVNIDIPSYAFCYTDPECLTGEDFVEAVS